MVNLKKTNLPAVIEGKDFIVADGSLHMILPSKEYVPFEDFLEILSGKYFSEGFSMGYKQGYEESLRDKVSDN